MEAVDVQAFAGGFTLGAAQAGFDVIAKREMLGGFGAPSVLNNADLLNPAGEIDYEEADPAEWTPKNVPLVISNPPCSAFSMITNKKHRGMDSSINDCMWATVEYGARCDADIVIFESVMQAFSRGRELMQALRERMEERTGDKYALHHTIQNGYALGGPAIRKRYFFVISRIPFGIEPPEVVRVPVLREVLGDLLGLDTELVGDQKKKVEESWWVKEQGIGRDDGMVDGHFVQPSKGALRLAQYAAAGWGNESFGNFVKRLHETDSVPNFVPEEDVQKWVDKEFRLGFNQASRWHPERAGRVVTGGGPSQIIHPIEDRLISLREAYRLQGFPDTWKLGFLDRKGGHWGWPGKGIPVQAGKWIAGWAKNALEGNPGGWIGEEIGDNEFLTKSHLDHKLVYDEKTGERGEDHTSSGWKHQMSLRSEQRRETALSG